MSSLSVSLGLPPAIPENYRLMLANKNERRGHVPRALRAEDNLDFVIRRVPPSSPPFPPRSLSFDPSVPRIRRTRKRRATLAAAARVLVYAIFPCFSSTSSFARFCGVRVTFALGGRSLSGGALGRLVLEFVDFADCCGSLDEGFRNFGNSYSLYLFIYELNVTFVSIVNLRSRLGTNTGNCSSPD